MNDLYRLIKNTQMLKEEIHEFLNYCNLIYNPLQKEFNNVVVLTGYGSYKLDAEDKSTLKRIEYEWEVWVDKTNPFIKHNLEIENKVLALNQIIKCGWRVHNSNINELKNQFEDVFNDVISTLNIQLKYTNSSSENRELNAEKLNITIHTNSTKVVINNPIQLYDDINKIITESDLPESDKNEISELLDAAKSEPQDIGKFKSVANRINGLACKINPTLNVVSSLMGIISKIL